MSNPNEPLREKIKAIRHLIGTYKGKPEYSQPLGDYLEEDELDQVIALIADDKRALLERVDNDSELDDYLRNEDNQWCNPQESGEVDVARKVRDTLNNLKEEVKEL